MSALLFAYGSLMRGESEHEPLEQATCLGRAVVPSARLVDLGSCPAMVLVTAPGAPDPWTVVGELYQVDAVVLTRLDVIKQHPALFRRQLVSLDDAREAYAYVMTDEQLRGRRRLPHGDWKRRFEARPRAEFTQPRRWRR